MKRFARRGMLRARAPQAPPREQTALGQQGRVAGSGVSPRVPRVCLSTDLSAPKTISAAIAASLAIGLPGWLAPCYSGSSLVIPFLSTVCGESAVYYLVEF